MMRFMMEAKEAAELAEISGVTVVDLLKSVMKSAQSLARPRISNFPVAAVALASDGRIFVGVNLEFPGLPLHQSVHAEQFVIVNASLHGAAGIDYIAVSSVPCGHCRQFLQELPGASDIKILVAAKPGEYSYLPLSDLLPHRFGPCDLLPEGRRLLLQPRNNELTAAPRNGISGAMEQLRIAALEAANRSHAPYTGCPSGAALMDSRGRLFPGSYFESAAYNPSLGPLQAALVAYVSGGGGEYEEIVAAALAEFEGGVASQESTARLLIQSISPHCEFDVFRALAKPQ